MAGKFKIEIPISVKGEKESGKHIGENVVSQIKKSLKTIGVGDKKISGVAGTKTGDGGAMGFLSKGIGKMTGLLAIVATAIEAVYLFIKPVMELLKTVFLLLFMPLIPILKPVMILLGQLAKHMGPIMSEMAKAIDGIMEPLNEVIKTTFDSLGKPIQELYIALIQILSGFIQSLPNILPVIITFIEFLGENLAKMVPIIIEALTWAGEFLIKGWGTIKDALDWVGEFFLSGWDTIKGILVWIGKWLEPIWNSIKGMLNDAYDGIKEKWGIIISFLDGVANALSTIKKTLESFNPSGFLNPSGGIIKAIGKLLGFEKGGVVPGAVGSPQLEVVHGGEQIIPHGQNKSVVLQPTFQITANISQDIDIDELSRRYGQQTEMQLKQRGII